MVECGQLPGSVACAAAARASEVLDSPAARNGGRHRYGTGLPDICRLDVDYPEKLNRVPTAFRI
jgi:hypothetical protein